MDKEQQKNVLMQKGFDLIHDEEFDQALEVGMKLQEMRHSSCFEIMAQAHAGKGEMEKVIEVLEGGVEKAPLAWPLWQLLGNFRDDLGRHEAALEAYDRALGCPEAFVDSINLNKAILLNRQDRRREALELLEAIGREDERIHVRAVVETIDIWIEQERYSEALDLAEETLERVSVDCPDHLVSLLLTVSALALWYGPKQRDEALGRAREALQFDRSREPALRLIREIHHKRLADGKMHQLLVRGRSQDTQENGEALSFFTTYDVVANSAEQGLEFARQLEPEVVAPTLKIEEAHERGPRPGELAGVYRMTNFAFYPASDDED